MGPLSPRRGEKRGKRLPTGGKSGVKVFHDKMPERWVRTKPYYLYHSDEKFTSRKEFQEKHQDKIEAFLKDFENLEQTFSETNIQQIIKQQQEIPTKSKLVKKLQELEINLKYYKALIITGLLSDIKRNDKDKLSDGDDHDDGNFINDREMCQQTRNQLELERVELLKDIQTLSIAFQRTPPVKKILIFPFFIFFFKGSRC